MEAVDAMERMLAQYTQGPSEPSHRRVIYTAIFGAYDAASRPPPLLSEGWDFVAFTDGEPLPAPWRTVHVESRDDPQRLARAFKILDHATLEAYDETVWVDGSATLLVPPARLSQLLPESSAISVFRHPSRHSLRAEALACVVYGKAPASLVARQVWAYEREGLPSEAPLIASGLVLRRTGDAQLRRLMREWYANLSRYSARDQLSFGYATWATGVRPRVLNHDIFANPFVSFRAHATAPLGLRVASRLAALRRRLL